ncbi:dipeptidase [Algoriphagus resistens]|uniref:dipeptidase n=1 Tax=Algoriphagus resistens TaxID=1750590 RepID=UPI0007168CF2|nr:membrane dipeptidase [Algoriphagus resistens]
MKFPISDMHCDLLSYLARIPGANPYAKDDIACAVPWLHAGGVRMQILAIYTDVKSESMDLAARQAVIFDELCQKHKDDFTLIDTDFLQNWEKQNCIGIKASVENAAGFGNESANWDDIYNQFDFILGKVKSLAYISLTHHTENRFGGGNYTKGIGLKEDGKKLLDYMAGKQIPVDLSHSSDLLAEGILNHIDSNKLDIAVIASHSNFRTIWNHPRNLTDEFAKEIIHRGGIIGVNFLRAFLDPEVPERLFDHIFHGFQIGGEKSICFGADYFYTKDFEDSSRHPFYFPLVENAGKYPSLIESLKDKLTGEDLENLAYRNALTFFRKIQS